MEGPGQAWVSLVEAAHFCRCQSVHVRVSYLLCEPWLTHCLEPDFTVNPFGPTLYFIAVLWRLPPFCWTCGRAAQLGTVRDNCLRERRERIFGTILCSCLPPRHGRSE
jgi:hypothetical protein